MVAYNSLPEMFFAQAKQLGSKIAERYKVEGEWRDLSWRELSFTVELIASGLMALGAKKGDALALMSPTRPEWVHMDLACLSLGGVVIPIYPSNTAEQAKYIIENSESRFLVLEDDGQLQKMMPIRSEIPKVEKIIVIQGPLSDQGEDVLTLDELKELGTTHLEEKAPEIDRIISGLELDEIATIVYTSGTTGPPKGVPQSHKNILAMCESVSEVLQMVEDESVLLWLPLAHSFARLVAFADIYNGVTTCFAESDEYLEVSQRGTRICFATGTEAASTDSGSFKSIFDIRIFLSSIFC